MPVTTCASVRDAAEDCAAPVVEELCKAAEIHACGQHEEDCCKADREPRQAPTPSCGRPRARSSFPEITTKKPATAETNAIVSSHPLTSSHAGRVKR
jgi:hypothetical protein